MIDRADYQDNGGAEIPGEPDGILERFLHESRRDRKENNLFPEILLKENFNNNKKRIHREIVSFEKSYLKKEIISLNRIGTLRLEEENVNRRLDDFIREGMGRRIPQGANRPLPLNNLRVPGSKTLFSSSTGLGALAYKGVVYPKHTTVNGEKMALEDYADIHFTPEGRRHFNQSKMTESLTSGIQGIVELIEAIDQGKFEAVSMFVGHTNINMALIAQRLGFVIADQCRNPDGSINKNLRSFTVVGKLDDIRGRVEEFKRVGIDQKLAQRNQRLRAKPKLAPAGT